MNFWSRLKTTRFARWGLSATLRDSLPPESPVEDFYRGAFAAEEHRWDDVTATLARMRGEAQRLEEESQDLAGSRLFSAAARALDGYAYWNSDFSEESVYELEKNRASATAWSSAAVSINGAIRQWIAVAWMELDRPGDAARYYDTFWIDPMAALNAARAYTALGDSTRAQGAYARVVEGWVEPDAELAPLVVEARGAAAGNNERDRGGAPRAAATCPSCPRLSSRS